MRENGIGINRGNPFLKKGGFTRAPSGERCGDLFEKRSRPPKTFKLKGIGAGLSLGR